MSCALLLAAACPAAAEERGVAAARGGQQTVQRAVDLDAAAGVMRSTLRRQGFERVTADCRRVAPRRASCALRARDGGAVWSGSGTVRRDGDASVVEYLVQAA